MSITIGTVLMRTPKVRAMHGLFDVDAVQDWFAEASISELADLQPNKKQVSMRTAIRALAATMPNRSLDDCANRIHAFLDNQHLTIGEVRSILRGAGKEIPFEKIQGVGRMLSEGWDYAKISRELGVDRETVSRIDHFLGMRTARRDMLISHAIQQMEDGDPNTRAFSRRMGITHHEARIVMAEALKVKEELA